MKHIYKQIGGLRGIALGALEIVLFFLAVIACGLAFVAVVP